MQGNGAVRRRTHPAGVFRIAAEEVRALLGPSWSDSRWASVASWLLSGPGPGEPLGNAGSTQVQLRRALERGNLVAAELAAREIGRLALVDALELTALIALRDRDRGRRAAMRWLRWWLEARSPTLDETAIVVANLAALGGHGHAAALAALRQDARQVRLRGRAR
jgi:hypothetical protein